MLHLAAFAAPFSPHQQDKTKLAVIQLLTLYPDLLFIEGRVSDPAGRVIEGSIYKILLGAGDVWACKKVHAEIIPRIENGEAIAMKQFSEQFPRSTNARLNEEERLYDNRNIAQLVQIKEDLKEIVIAFSADPCTGAVAKPETEAAIEKLRAHLAPKVGEVIRTGLHSPPELMRTIHEVYDHHYEPWSVDKLRLYSCEVIRAAETVAAAVDAQCYKNGLFYLDINSGPNRLVTYFDLTGVLADHASSIYEGGVMNRTGPMDFCSLVAGAIEGLLDRGGWLANYVEQKQQIFRNIMQQSMQQQHPHVLTSEQSGCVMF
jgi:hypothetical protein